MPAQTFPKDSHGCIWSVEFAPGVFTEIAELGDIELPEMSRKDFDASVHNRNIDGVVLGILRRGAFTVPLNFIEDNATHDHQTGLYKLLIENTLTGHKVTFPDGLVWILSGQVANIKPKMPVDGKQAADVTVRFTGLMKIGSVTIGA